MYNNYGYNPYYPQQRYQGVDTNNQQPMMTTYQQPMQLTKPSSLLGKSVDNIDVVKATDIPLPFIICIFVDFFNAKKIFDAYNVFRVTDKISR